MPSSLRALVLTALFAAVVLCAPAQAFAVSDREKALDFSGTEVLAAKGGSYTLPTSAAALAANPLDDEWAEYGWKLVAEQDGAKYQVVLVLRDGFFLYRSAPSEFALKLPFFSWSDASGTSIRMEGSGTALIHTKGASESSAGMVLGSGVAIREASGSTARLQVVNDAAGACLHAEGDLTIRGAEVSLHGTAEQSIGLTAKGHVALVDGAAVDCKARKAGVYGEGDLSVQTKSTLAAVGGEGVGLIAKGKLSVSENPGTKDSLIAYGAQGGIRCASATVKDGAMVQASGQQERGVESYSADGFVSTGDVTIENSIVVARGITGLLVGDADHPANLTVNMLNAGNLEVEGSSDSVGTLVCGALVHGKATLSGGTLEASAKSTKGAALGSAAFASRGSLTLNGVMAYDVKGEGTNVVAWYAAGLFTVCGGSTLAASAEHIAADVQNGALFTGKNTWAAFTSNAYGSSGLRCFGELTIDDGATLNANAAGANSVGLRVGKSMASKTEALLNVEKGTLKATGEEAAFIIFRDGDRAGDPTPVSLGAGVALQKGGSIASVVAEPLHIKETYWTLSETGQIGFENGKLTGAATKIRISDALPAYYLEVDGAILLAEDDKGNVKDASIPGVADFSAVDRRLTLHGSDDTKNPQAIKGIKAQGLAEGAATGALTLVFDGSIRVDAPAGQDASDGQGSTDQPSQPAVNSTGPLVVVGDDEAALAVLGTLSLDVDGAGNPGSFTLKSGTMVLLGMSGDDVAFKTKGNATRHDASAELAGGSIIVLGLDKLSGMNIDGDLKVTGAAEGQQHQIISIGGFGAKVAGTYEQTAASLMLLGMGGTGLEVANSAASDTAINFGGGSSTLLGLGLSDGNASSSCYGALAVAGNVRVAGGSHAVVGAGFQAGDAALKVQQGSLISTDGKLTATGASGEGIHINDGSMLKVEGGSVEGSGTTGVRAGSTLIEGGVLNALGTPGVLGSLAEGDLENLRALGIDTTNLQELIKRAQAGDSPVIVDGALDRPADSLVAVDTKILASRSAVDGAPVDAFGLYAEQEVSITGGVVNAFVFRQGLSSVAGGAGDRSFGIHAGTGVQIAGGTVCALADVASGDATTAIGIHAGSLVDSAGGNIALVGGTTTAYAFPTAARRAAALTASGSGAVVGTTLKVAAGDRAPGVQVDSSAGLSAHSYLYATPGKLYLTPDHMKWDYLDQRSFALAAAFDPPDGELKVSMEMMASIVGLDRMTLILSDGIDFSKETFIASYGEAYSQSQALDPDNLNPKIYYGPLFRGMGAAFLFENGQLFGKKTLHNVAGVEVYDFGSCYDTQPELAGIRALLSNEEALVHSVHFNYAGELPADTTVIMAVGDSYKMKRLDWKYSDASFTSLTSVCSLDTDPFGWFSAEGQKTLQQKTALIGEKNVGDSVMKQLASTGDNKTDAVVALSLLVAMLSVALGAALIQQRRKKMLPTR